jgi:hypothetical protein
MNMSKFDKKKHGNDAKLKKGLKHHGWVTGHGWGLHGGTWKMGGWGPNIAPKMLHVSRAQATQTSKHAVGCPLKLDMFRWVVVLKFLFGGSCFVVCAFRLAEMNAMPPLKHDMFPCQFAPESPLPMCGNSCQATLERATHL